MSDEKMNPNTEDVPPWDADRLLELAAKALLAARSGKLPPPIQKEPEDEPIGYAVLRENDIRPEGAMQVPAGVQGFLLNPTPSAINAATSTTPGVIAAIDEMFAYHPWDDSMTERGNEVRRALVHAVRVIVNMVPPGPDRSTAIRKIREARMDANSAITHNGRY